MLSNLKVPGVYTEEVSTLPPSVAPVETAIPAFIGYTERSGPAGTDLTAVPTRIESLLEYERLFGSGPEVHYSGVELDAGGRITAVDASLPYLLHESLRLFYANGGGVCYVVSAGTYREDRTVDAADFFKGDTEADTDPLVQIGKVDEITLLLAPDAYRIGAQLGELHKRMLRQCGELMDRFALLDPPLDGDGEVDLDSLRNGTGMEYLSYGAAYAPYLRIVPTGRIGYLSHPDLPLTGSVTTTLKQYVDDRIADPAEHPYRSWNTLTAAHTDYRADLDDAANRSATLDAVDALATAAGLEVADSPTLTAYRAAISGADASTDAGELDELLVSARDGLPFLGAQESVLRGYLPAYGDLVRGLEQRAFVVPPSGAVAGAIARTDGARGVWQAAANVSLNGTLGPSERFTRTELADMNVHAATGKSVNAIRAFAGKGTLIFGARTLAGNDNEYRYVPVRRLLIFLEESIKKASERYVFEANDANTWTRIRGMIENFLNLQWRAGALQGASPAEAYRVSVGMGTTMTTDDVTSGRMIVVVSVAPVRPAEFIVLRFTQHQLQ